MKKNKYFLPMILLAGLMLVSFSVLIVNSQSTQTKQVKQEAVTYTCPMHPEVKKTNPGNCPKCGMTLVIKKDRAIENTVNPKDSSGMKQSQPKIMHDSTSLKRDYLKTDSNYLKNNNRLM